MENSSQPSQKNKPVTVLYSALDNYGGYPFTDMFDMVHPAYMPHDMFSDNGVLVVWGGGDISPSMYGQKPGPHTGATEEMSSRDQLELNLMADAMKRGIPILGICRGAQMLCAVAGGTLVQDVSGHTKDHFIKTDTGKIFKATSLHHQMMYPWKVDHKLIAWSSPPISKYYGGQLEEIVTFPDDVDETREPEVVYFPTIKGLAIQGHPEFIHNEKHEYLQYSRALVKQYLTKPFLKTDD